MIPQSNDLEQQMAMVKQAVQDALQQAKQAGASAAECSMSQSSGIAVGTRMGEVETVEFTQDGALGISVYRDHCKGSASTTDLSPQAIKATVEKACEIARFTSADPYNGLAPAELMAQHYPDLALCYPGDQSPDYAIAQALACERHALAQDPRITNSDGAHYGSHCGFRVYGNSHGFLGGYLQSRHDLSCVVIASQDDKMQRDMSYSVARKTSDLLAPEQVAEEAVTQTLARLGSRKVKTAKVPVIFRADVAGSFWGHLVSAISGGSLYRKASFLLDRLGDKIFPEFLTIHEDPHIVGGLASSPFDAEGVQTQAREIISDGQLQTYLLTSYAARKLDRQVTGHAGGIHNWQISHGDDDLAALCKQMGTGLLVTELMGQGVNLVNGDYSRGAAGFWVENGEIQYPVDEVTIAGNLKDMFANMVAVGNDIDPRHAVKSGSILLAEMKVAGQ
ncbi:metalloprotease PmbA [Idiomarina tyrosinivorans]|uniref:Metalloprotease PmbA n=1 Tax=Idiomarina tyrosinivorans TaxID=1445662 RepID=A0A432ZQE1_9GAMM|nr:metalloprotease PmbA [Idiomarina tyrosinivorans]RUO80124.1 metalloprotease PmbA [Idiomarina tyrosinivorans]